MANTFKLKRSSSPGKIPSTSDLEPGELGINYYDAAIYMKQNDGVDKIIRIAHGNQDYGLITGSVNGSLDYGALF